MINEKIQQALNDQIQREFFSAYIYLSMASYLNEIGLRGFSHWMKAQSEEEISHGMKIYEYILTRNGRVILQAVQQPPIEWNSAVNVFEDALTHEEYITSEIYKIADLAEEVNDRATLSFLQWFIDEQVEEEAQVRDILQNLQMVGNDSTGMLEIDGTLAGRTASCTCCDSNCDCGCQG